jgi:hypothetical protein
MIGHSMAITKVKRRKKRKIGKKAQPLEAITKAVRDPHPVDPDKLLTTLYFLYDAFERASLDFFLVRQTARDVINGKRLTTMPVTIGIRHNEWIGGNEELLLAYFEQEHVEMTEKADDHVTFVYQDIPIMMHIYRDSDSVTALNSVAYEFETWKIPNQFERFEKEFDTQ